MPTVPGLRSPYAKVGPLVYFGRMLDKIRLHTAGGLPSEYCSNLGEPRPFLFDARCCRFLRVAYADLQARTLQGGTDEEILAWAQQQSPSRTEDEINVWNRFMMKIGWRDDRHEILRQRIAEGGLDTLPIETFFDLIDYDEGRDPARARPWEPRSARIILLMGVSGSGKTTIGQALAQALGWPFSDADTFHPSSNIAQMTAGIPLDDLARAPWLAAIRTHIDDRFYYGENAVITCSALKEAHRAALMTHRPGLHLIHLKGSPALLRQRLETRTDHFMKATLLDSQLTVLEEPTEALTVDISPSPAEIVAHIRQHLGL